MDWEAENPWQAVVSETIVRLRHKQAHADIAAWLAAQLLPLSNAYDVPLARRSA